MYTYFRAQRSSEKCPQKPIALPRHYQLGPGSWQGVRPFSRGQGMDRGDLGMAYMGIRGRLNTVTVQRKNHQGLSPFSSSFGVSVDESMIHIRTFDDLFLNFEVDAGLFFEQVSEKLGWIRFVGFAGKPWNPYMYVYLYIYIYII